MSLSSFFSPGGTDQTSSSYSGLRGPGWDYSQQMGQYLTPTIQSGANSGLNMFNNPSQYLTNGLYSDQANLLPTLVNLAGNLFSANGAARGQLSPENNGAIAGSVATNLAPNLFSMIASNMNDIRTAGGNMFSNSIGSGVNALGGISSNASTNRGAGIGYNMANQFFSNAMEGFSAPKMMSSIGGGSGAAALF